MKNVTKQSIGIDISSKDFVASLAVIDQEQNVSILSTKKFINSEGGFKSFLIWVDNFTDCSIPTVFTMEATGVYFESLAYYLTDQNKQVSVLLPNKVSNYAKTLKYKSKNDAIDSKIIAFLGAERKLNLWTPPSPMLREIKQLIRERNELIKERIQVNNQLHSKKASYQYNTNSIKRNKKRIAFINSQIEDIMDDIDNILKTDDDLMKRVIKMETIKGVGRLTILTILAETNGFSLIKNRKQLVSFCGFDVVEKQSGTSLNGKTRISKKGNKFIRKALHYPSLSATQHDEIFRTFYQRLNDRNTSKMVGLVAVQRKLLLLIYALWKSGETYNPNYNRQEKEIKTIA